ncbi:MAG: hypothetical protein ABIN74_05375 [Ferruginibacter sp.]
MPNHVHGIFSFTETSQSINTIIGNGKRFMAYEIINRLKHNKETDLLLMLGSSVETKRKANNKKHDVWELSFDWKECISIALANQKLEYIHCNPCTGKWNLCNLPEEYEHSSAKFYATGQQGVYKVTNIMEMEDVVFVRRK